MTAKRIVAVPRLHHGLGNRIRVVLSAQDLAESTGREFAYVWPTGAPFGADLEDLWQVDMLRISLLRSRMHSLRHPYRDASEEWREEAANDSIWQIRTSQPISIHGAVDTWHHRLRALRPSSQVEDRVTAIFDERLRGAPYLGVMVRSHAVSHENTLRESPMEWYLDRIADIRRRRPDIDLFVSADTPEAFDHVVSSFPRAYGVREKGAYNSRAALIAAVADLYLLAGSTHILGPHYSSFPELAQYLAGPEVALETSMSAPETSFESMHALSMVDDPMRPSQRIFC